MSESRHDGWQRAALECGALNERAIPGLRCDIR
jgi:hypothetical protein